MSIGFGSRLYSVNNILTNKELETAFAKNLARDQNLIFRQSSKNFTTKNNQSA